MYAITPRRRSRQLSPFQPFGKFVSFESPTASLMKTDISESETSYDFNVELPGFSKENVSAQIENGYLVINASAHSTSEETSQTSTQAPTESAAQTVTDQSSEGTSQATPSAEGTEQKTTQGQTGWLRRERYFGNCRRSYYLGEEIDKEGITAKFENGLLSVNVPKLVKKEETTSIAIS